MEKSTMMYQNPSTGKLRPFDFKAEDGNFTFTAKENSNSLIENQSKADDLSYSDFAAIRDDAMLKAQREGDEDLTDAFFLEGLATFAASQGPLFGYGIHKTSNVVIEPIADWIDAQRAMDIALKIAAFSKNGKIFSPLSEALKVHSIGLYGMTLSLSLGFAPSPLYLTCLNKSDHVAIDRGTTIDHSIWSDGEEPDSELGAIYSSCIKGTGGLPSEFDLGNPTVRKAARNYSSDLLEAIIYGHLGAAELGFNRSQIAPRTTNEWSYGIICKCHLAYMWHRLAQDYANNSFIKCNNPKCGKILAINARTHASKAFCSDYCRAQANNLKNTEQCRRARNAFYACKSFEEIYNEAFERPLSFKDPEYTKLSKRLERWIEKDFSRSRRGKAALKQGAGHLSERH